MATQQQFPLDPNTALAPLWIRTGRRKRHQDEVLPLRPATMRQEQLRSYAHMEAQSWLVVDIKERASFLETKWREAKDSIETRWEALRDSSAAGHALNGEAMALIDNAGLLRESLQEAREVLRNAGRLAQVESTGYQCVPRVYASLASYFRAVNYEFNEQTFGQFFTSVQEAAAFEMAELWQLRPFAKFALLEALAERADEMESVPYSGLRARRGEYESSGGEIASVQTLVASLRLISEADWKELFEQINVVEQILRKDPCGAYSQMDFETRDSYRKTITQMAERSKTNEESIAQAALSLASRSHRRGDEGIGERQSHVGYYLLGGGRKALEREIGYRRTLAERVQGFVMHWPDFSYILGIELVTCLLIAAAVLGAGSQVSGFALVALLLLPAAECAVALINQIATTLVPPKVLPKLDFTKGIPAEFTTIVAVPTLLTSESQMRSAVRDLEIRFLANRDSNLHFALLTDPPDAAQQFDERDQLARACAELIEGLNAKYVPEDKGSFFLFHRHRSYNKSEGIWMGWERKRGKLLDFNNLLLGASDNFPVKTGNVGILPNVKYVITLDLDTQLPRDAARRLVGTIAHPLNKAVVDAATNTVVQGYGILQPRVDISIQSANRSRLAAILSSDAGFDIYTRAVSDVYQDLFNEGSFTGKGIYEVKTFQQVLEHRFPCNTILSHDMIEGAYARAGLVSDIEVIDDYPSHMSALSRRKHRWVRGDWQIVFWLLPRVPNFFGKMVRNPLSIISRWKILDNLRRSLTEMAMFVMLLSGWLFFPGHALYWTLVTLGLLTLPTYTQFALTIVRARRTLLTSAFWKNLAADFGVSQANLFMRVACLCHQSLVTIDAVVRAIVRMTVTHERLLEWETSAEAEERNQKKSPVEIYLEITPWLAFFVGLFLAVGRPESFMVALPLLVLWGVSKPIVQWLSLPSRTGEKRMEARDEALLRRSALRTWRLFREFSTPEENWLIPDIIQEPASLIVHRISTTNLGLLLNSRLAAMDMGFLTLPEFIADTEKTFESIDRMPKLNGQPYNWYDNRTLEPVKPRFISSVDNGNLVCCLWTLKQGCLGAVNEPIFSAQIWTGVVDHLDTLEELLRPESWDERLRLVQQLKKRVKTLGALPANWAEALPAIERDVVALDKKLSESGSEIAWWGHELCLRITHLQSLFYDFAPWQAPEFAQYTDTRAMQNIIRSERLTLESLPRLCEALDRKLASILEEEGSGSETQSALRLLRSAIARTDDVASSLAKRLTAVAAKADSLAKSMNFVSLFDAKKKALSVGYEVEEQRLAPYFYDLLPSEARAATFVAIAKGEIPQDSWLSLERRYTSYQDERVLLSWTGTMFEYLMPMLWMKTYPNTILDETTQAAVRAQKKFAKSQSIPWGISESSCAKLSVDGHYHYQAFGVPELAVRQEKPEDLVVSPYSTFLALLADTEAAVENVRSLDEMGLLGAYGFYEAADFTPSRVKPGNTFEIVRCWLAHHQGMSLIAAANVLCNSASQRRFHAEPMVAATERLLHEKAPRVPNLEALQTDPDSVTDNLTGEQAGGAQENASAQENCLSAPKLNTAA
ncbi:MAG TPA: glucoamylase family protein [Candidatus Acidoferrum sp.]|nr:glucoamylase family protein [Candidatus Acidoferrum sp.]